MTVGSAGGQVIVVCDVRWTKLGEVVRQGVQPQGGGNVLATRVAAMQLAPRVGRRHIARRPEDVPPQGAAGPVILQGRGVSYRAPRHLSTYIH